MALNDAKMTVQQETSDLDFKAMMTHDADYIVRLHEIEAIQKFTLALACLISSSSVRLWEPSSEREVWDSR